MGCRGRQPLHPHYRTSGLIVGAGVPDGPVPSTCHSEELSDEESREQNAMRNHTGSFAGAQDDRWVLESFAYTLPRLPFPGLLHDGPFQ